MEIRIRIKRMDKPEEIIGIQKIEIDFEAGVLSVKKDGYTTNYNLNDVEVVVNE